MRCWTTPVFWLCFWYLVGSLLILFAAAASVPPAEGLVDQLVNMPYLLGSAAFALGAWTTMWMWKTEQFGLGFIREIDELHLDDKPAGPGAGAFTSPYEGGRVSLALDVEPEGRHDGGHGTQCEASHEAGKTPGWNPGAIDLKQQVFMLVYVLLGVCSVLDICATVAFLVETEERHLYSGWKLGLRVSEPILSSLSDFFGAHTILLLATITHRTPTLAPYNYLLWGMRCIAVVYLTTSAVRLAEVFMVYEA